MSLGCIFFFFLFLHEAFCIEKQKFRFLKKNRGLRGNKIVVVQPDTKNLTPSFVLKCAAGGKRCPFTQFLEINSLS